MAEQSQVKRLKLSPKDSVQTPQPPIGERDSSQKRSTLETMAGLVLKYGGKEADIVVKCGDKQWKAHRSVLMNHCDFFKACLTNDWLEANTNTVTLNEDDPTACELFLEYLYTGSVRKMDAFRPSHSPEGCPRESHTSVTYPCMTSNILTSLCEMAHKYWVPDLMLLIAEFLDSNLEMCSVREGQFETLVLLLIETKEFAGMEETGALQEALVHRLNCHFGCVDDSNEAIGRFLLDDNDDLLASICLNSVEQLRGS